MPPEERSERDRGRAPPKRAPRRRVSARGAARSAARHVQELTGRDPEGVTSLERQDDGWLVGIEVVETHRIPDSTDILAVYQVTVGDHGELVSYRRDQRYYRGRSEG